MRRREFITLLGGAAAWPLAARAQQAERMHRIGVFMDLAEDDPEGQARVAALRRGLQDLGWIDGRNLRMEHRWAGGEASRMKPLAAELVTLAPEVIVSSGAPTLAALQQETHTIPLVFCQIVDPVAGGFVESLSRPGGNTTGFSSFEYAMGGKWLGALKEIAPNVGRVAVVRDTASGVGAIGMLGAIQAVMPTFAMQLIIAGGRDAVDFEHAINAFAKESNALLHVFFLHFLFLCV
jgi:putative ABC transport system substrate-binding protein